MIPKNPYQAYRKATHTVSKTRQVVMLYEGVLRNLQQAREAISEKRIEERYHKLVRASEIIVGLQMSLDFNQGEESAQALYDFYSAVDKNIIKLQRTNDLSLCDEMIADVRAMHDVWKNIDAGTLNKSDEVSMGQETPDADNNAATQEEHSALSVAEPPKSDPPEGKGNVIISA